MIRMFPALALLAMLGPIAVGLAGTVLPAFGWLPALGRSSISLDPWRDLLGQPGLLRSVGLSFGVGLGASAAAFLAALGFAAACYGTTAFAWIGRLLSPLLAVPHATVALGLAFLLAPSGWIARLLSPWATGWDRPPDLAILHDPWGIALGFGLLLKEVPFLFVMTLAALDRLDATRLHAAARSLGCRPMTAWIVVVLPRVYTRLRLPVLAVIAFSTSVVDMAVLLGPTTPAPLAVRVVGWTGDPDLDRRLLGSAGALLQVAVTAAAIATWLVAERLVARLGRGWLAQGVNGRHENWLRLPLGALAPLCAATAGAALLGLAVWSVAGSWRFPDALPATTGLGAWVGAAPILGGTLSVTVLTAVVSAGVATVLVVGCLENETRRGLRPPPWIDWVLYVPLLMPQVAFLFGLQVLFAATGIDGSWGALIWAHLVVVLPYVFLSLAGSWRRLDRRWAQTARTLGHGPGRVLLRVTLPLLLRPMLTAMAVGVSVSVAQYLPTLFAGAGRLTTLTTEAVALAGGGDRRVIGAFGLLQMAVPMVAFAAAQFLPSLLFRRRRGAAAAIDRNGHHREGFSRTGPARHTGPDASPRIP
ncbi:ABC transporter permease subunit [Thalassobaculum sp.]|uniref:ABC transporter permease n=1 Tax=Thalassobaculum sp. TaxID=2022740 RepID=UPI0032EF1EDA